MLLRQVAACIHVPGHYIASGLGPRYDYLRQLHQLGRVAVLFGLPRGPMGWRCAWIVVFRSAALRTRLLRHGWQEALSRPEFWSWLVHGLVSAAYMEGKTGDPWLV